MANDVSHGDIVGCDDNEVLLLTAQGVERWPRAPKTEIARKLAEKIAGALA